MMKRILLAICLLAASTAWGQELDSPFILPPLERGVTPWPYGKDPAFSNKMFSKELPDIVDKPTWQVISCQVADLPKYLGQGWEPFSAYPDKIIHYDSSGTIFQQFDTVRFWLKKRR